MNLTTEKLREYVKHTVKPNTVITEDDDYIYFTTTDILDGIVLASVGYAVEYKIEVDCYTMRAKKPDWFDKNSIMDYLNVCPDVHYIEETDTHIYFITDSIETIFALKPFGHKCIYQESLTTGMYRVSVCKN
jgi:hypothetical protein